MRWYQAYGGTGLTATTEQEYMKFDINLPANRVDLFLRVEADRMKNTQFREFDEEVMILVEQRLGDLNRPTTPFYEAMSAAVGVVHPVFWPEGYSTDFYQYTRAYQRDLYERYYVPNNTTLVFIGGVSLEEMIPKVDRWFGTMERGPEPMRTKAIEPEPAAERRVIWRANELSPRVDVRHQIPGVGHPDRPRIDVPRRGPAHGGRGPTRGWRSARRRRREHARHPHQSVRDPRVHQCRSGYRQCRHASRGRTCHSSGAHAHEEWRDPT